jgi:DnaK suppressor protein
MIVFGPHQNQQFLIRKLPTRRVHMGRTEKHRLRKMLLERRELILRHGRTGMLKSMTGEVIGAFDGVMDEGDVAHCDQSERIHYSILGSMRDIIRTIEAALQRIESGDYGICGECGGEIDIARLRIIPYALCCRDCQEEMEARKRRSN